MLTVLPEHHYAKVKLQYYQSAHELPHYFGFGAVKFNRIPDVPFSARLGTKTGETLSVL
jgi:hypothetical protein